MEAEARFSTLEDYKDFLRRRKWYIIIPWLLISGIAAGIAYMLPPVYRSTATILIESQQVPPDLIRTTVTSYAEERINAITQQILSRQVLLDLVKKYNLYPEKQGKVPVEQILEEMRKDIQVEMVSAEVPDRRGGRPVTVNVAFTVSFEGKDPQKVMQVTNQLASYFLEYNLKMREGLAKRTTQVLEEQVEQYREVVNELEDKIAKFKREHMKEMPELAGLNYETERELRRQIESIDNQIATIKDRIIYLRGQLATISPESPTAIGSAGQLLDPVQRLKALKNEEISLAANLSPKHPDVIRIRREIKRLEEEIGSSGKRAELEGLLRLKESELQDLKSKVTEKHPDVRRLKKEIERLKREIRFAPVESSAQADLPTNPAFINIQTQIKAAEIDLKGLYNKRQELEARWQEYIRRLEKMPEVEKQFRELTRDYETAQRKYAETMAKYLEAKQAQNLERAQASEKFTIIDPPQLPERPIKPNRLAIVLIGSVLGMGVGIGLAALMEMSDQTVRTPQDVLRATGKPVLATIMDVGQAARKKR